jgi:hypothetical protein
MEKLNKDELFLLATELDLSTLLKFCNSSKRIYEKVYKNYDIWYYILEKDFPDNHLLTLNPMNKNKLLYSLINLKEKRNNL